MENKNDRCFKTVFVTGFISLGIIATSSAAPTAEQGPQQIRHQQNLIIRQQKQILENQRKLESQNAQLKKASSTEGLPNNSKLPKGILSGVTPECPLGYIYDLFHGCVLYVAH